MTHRVLIADDEPMARERLRDLVNDCDGFKVIAEASDGQQALDLQAQFNPHIVILDLRMPGVDGMQAARSLSGPQAPALIFCTAYDDQAVQAFDVSAVDYVLKPVRRSRLKKALAKAAQQVPDSAHAHLRANIGGQVRLIPLDEIYYLKAEDKYVTVHYQGGECLIDDALKTLEQAHPDRLTRVHRNCLVATNQVSGLVRDRELGHAVTLRDDPARLGVSRRQLPLIRRLLKRL